ncbi:MAG: DNA ligase-associated DEXH box helicase, partial [Erythrobacter sp.]
MSAPFSWIRPEPWGVHVVPADCWVDPGRAVDRALVTHGHADHARGGHGETIATPETLAIMALRYRTGIEDGAGEMPSRATPVAYGETIRLPGGVDATFVPAGHVLGSAQILLEHAG